MIFPSGSIRIVFRSLRDPLLGIALALIPVSASPLLAQTGAYLAPGAVEMLERNEFRDFPDGQDARSWLLGFRRGLVLPCAQSLDDRDMDPQIVREAGGPVQASLRLGRFVNSAIPQLAEGIADGRAWVEAHGCESRISIATTVTSIMILNGDHPPNATDEPAFFALLAPGFRETLGYDAEGRIRLTPEMSEASGALRPAVVRYLQTRRQGALSDDELVAVAGEIADLIVTSGITRESLEDMRGSDYDGNAVLRLWVIPMKESGLREDLDDGRTPFSAPRDPLDEFAERNWNEMVDMLRRVGIVAPDSLVPVREEAARLAALARDIREALPPELSTALDWLGVGTERWAEESDAERTLREEVWTAMTGEGLMSRGGDFASGCRADREGRFDRFAAGRVNLGPGGEATFEALRYAVIKPEDPVEYDLNNTPRVPGTRETWRMDVRELDWEREERSSDGECLRIEIPVKEGRAGAEHDAYSFEQRPTRNPDPTRLSTLSGEHVRARASVVVIQDDPERAERLRVHLQDYARRYDAVAAGRPDPGPSLEAATPLPAPDREPDNPVGNLPPPGSPGEAGGIAWTDENRVNSDPELARLQGGPQFTPFSTPPRLANEDEVRDAIRRAFPPAVRAEGYPVTVQAQVLVDTEGRVVAVSIPQPSEITSMNNAALEVARSMRFTPAKNGDDPTPVWMGTPIQFDPHMY